MNLHEYQAKQLFTRYGLPAPAGYACSTPREAEEAASKIGSGPWVVKCQVHAGGRGKAGGVKLVKSKDEIRAFAEQWLGKRLVTYQTDALGQPVHQVLVEGATDIAKELYLGAVVDRGSRRVVFMASTEGGVEIEKVAHETPELIHKAVIDPLTGPMPYQGRELAFKLGLTGKLVSQFTKIFMGLATMFLERDLAMAEINPLVITTQDELICLDGKLGIDGNALYRQPELREMHDPSQEDAREAQAAQWELNYVALDGNIGCMVNGAGLAMGTMDIVKLHGGEPANFLDVGGGADEPKVTAAFKIIMADPNVKGILVNIFGGIARCDILANGVVNAVKQVGLTVPLVVRLEGTNAELGKKIINESGLNVIAANDLSDGAEKIVKAVREAN